MNMYEPFLQVSIWEDSFKVDHSTLNSIASPMLKMNITSMENKSECIPQESREPSGDDQETIQEPVPKVLRRQAQNRAAARKCRLRKKAYVQQLETSRLKLMQLELDIEKTRKQGLYKSSLSDVGYMGSSGTINSVMLCFEAGISLFEIEYGRWIEEQDRQNEELRNALQTNASDIQLHLLVESSLNQYSNLFRMKAEAAKADVFYLISGVWKSPVERLFLWIGGSRPSQILNQAEDALSIGLEKLQQSMINNIQADPLDFGNYGFQMAAAIDKGEAVEGFVIQADHLRQQTLLYMSRILSIGQAAQGLLAMGEYFHRLRTLSSLWTARSCHHFYPTQHSN
ncbi:transcription factor TGA3 isoform X4 [Medicago truncatula]|uniref:transcription factor TGA3 isoform X4 n=1 Tax=Medicago truncatula TaxID=3880 RepID=UPI000D2F3902|nr:transcription factor TGA3 isoform X4 [Medicago truncatula]